MTMNPDPAADATEPAHMPQTETTRDAARTELGLHGSVRVALNAANTIVARIGADGSPSGIAVEAAQAIGEQLGLPVTFRMYASAGAIVAAADEDAWDLAFIARDPSREHLVHFTPPYKQIAATFAVARQAGLTHAADLDRSDTVIASADGAAYDAQLRRVMTRARIVGCDDPNAARTLFLSGGANALAGIRDQLRQIAAENSEVRLVDDDFATLGQAIAVRRGWYAAASFLDDWIQRLGLE